MDIERSRHLIQQVCKSIKQILHTTNDLVYVVNQTYHELSLHCTHLLDIEKSVTKLFDQVDTSTVKRMRNSLSIDRSLTLLESRQMFWFHIMAHLFFPCHEGPRDLL